MPAVLPLVGRSAGRSWAGLGAPARSRLGFARDRCGVGVCGEGGWVVMTASLVDATWPLEPPDG